MRVVSVGLATALLSCAVAQADAEQLNADAAQRFVVGRTFSYTCYEGTVGAGKVMKDGSVAGTIQVRGKGNMRYVTLPAGTIQVKGEAVCAKVKGVAFQPCFDLEKTNADAFRGNLAGFDRMWCEFKRGGSGRTRLVENARPKPTSTRTAQATQVDDAH